MTVTALFPISVDLALELTSLGHPVGRQEQDGHTRHHAQRDGGLRLDERAGRRRHGDRSERMPPNVAQPPPMIREAIVRAITSIAPEISPAGLDDHAPLRDTLDLDSMDFLNLLVSLSQSLQVELPESHYGRLRTLDALVDYLAQKLERRG
jgi:acyl carrier protein